MTTAQKELLERVRARRVLPVAAERRRIREAADVSQHELAKALGVSWTASYRWEKARGHASTGTRWHTRICSTSCSASLPKARAAPQEPPDSTKGEPCKAYISPGSAPAFRRRSRA